MRTTRARALLRAAPPLRREVGLELARRKHAMRFKEGFANGRVYAGNHVLISWMQGAVDALRLDGKQ